MRKVSLAVVKDSAADGTEVSVSYGMLLHAILDFPGERGTTKDTLMSYFPAKRALLAAEEAKAEFVLFEETQWQFLVRCMNEFHWGVRRMWQEDFINAVEKAEVVDPNKKEEKSDAAPAA